MKAKMSSDKIFLLPGLFIAVVLLLFITGCGTSTPSPTPQASQWEALNSIVRGRPINGIHGTAADNVFAVSDWDTLIHYNGANWSICAVEAPAGHAYYKVWSPAANVAYIVADDHRIRKYDHGTWSFVYTDPDPKQRIYSIFGFSADDIYIGVAGFVHHYNGTEWSSVEVSSDSMIMGIWGSSRSNMFAVDLEGRIYHDNGAGWVKQAEFSATRFQSIYGVAADKVYAVAREGTALVARYNGTTWEIDSGVGFGNGFDDVWGSAADDIYIVGMNGGIGHYDGTSWEQVFDIPAVLYQGVWGSSKDDVMIGGDQGILLRKNGANWDEELGELRGSFYAIWGTGSDNMYFGGKSVKWDSDATILRHNGTSFAQVDTGSTYDVIGLWGTSDSNLFAATDYSSGQSHAGELLHYNGTSWSQLLEFNRFIFCDIWGTSTSTSASAVFAVGFGQDDDGNYFSRLMSYDGNNFVTAEVITNHMINKITGLSSREVYFCGQDSSAATFTTHLYRYNGSSVEVMAGPAGEQVWSICGLPGKGLYAGTWQGKLYFYNGSVWTHLASVPGNYPITALWAVSENDIYLNGDSVRHFNGSVLSDPMTPYTKEVARIWGTSADNVCMVGSNGMIMRLKRGQ